MSVAPKPLPAAHGGSLFNVSNLGDRVFRTLCTLAALTIIGVSLLLVVVMVDHSWLSIRETGLGFFTSQIWDPEPDHRVFGALAFIYGTVVTSALAMLIAVPLGVGTAAYLSEIAPAWVRKISSFLIEMLAAIPSVVYGLWGMYVLAPVLQDLVTAFGGDNTGGRGIFSASVVLSIMIVPYVTAVSFDVCRAVPSSQRQAALALGATRWQTIWTAVLPYARPGIVAASFLALGRALGETMAVTMLIGNKERIAWTPFALGDSIASRIANQFTEATYDLFRSALMELGLVLLIVTLVVNMLARLLIWQMTRTKRGPTLWERVWKQRPLPSPPSRRDDNATAPAPGNQRAKVMDRIMSAVLLACLICTILPLFFILGYLLYKGVTSLNWAFFTEIHVPLGEVGGGMAHALYGSGMLVGLATMFAVPIGLLTAIYLSEYRNGPLAHSVRFIGEMLGGVPSIVMGIFAYYIVVMPLIEVTNGKVRFCGWAGAFALGVMMISIVMRASEEALKLVPKTLRSASMALGANHWQTIVRITVPAALPAIVTAISLAIARIAGETAPLLLTASDNRDFPAGPSDPTPSIPVLIFKYSVSPYPDWHRKAWAAALVLMFVVLALNFGIRLITGKRVVLAARAD
ncbi:MAG: phosphate ABC transporter permease subunit PstC [Gemmataceae bacterium]|nr:phosphate ABC transporter permease subunit PstC [Gemmataceae bacterium]